MSEPVGSSRKLLYDTDFFEWTVRQAAVLRRHAAPEIDWENAAEEIESLGKNERREVRDRLKVLVAELLKWAFQLKHRSRSWRSMIRTQRHDLEYVFDDSPSLRLFAAATLAECYADGRNDALGQTGLFRLPEICPWTIEQILDSDFWPDS